MLTSFDHTLSTTSDSVCASMRAASTCRVRPSTETAKPSPARVDRRPAAGGRRFRPRTARQRSPSARGLRRCQRARQRLRRSADRRRRRPPAPTATAPPRAPRRSPRSPRAPASARRTAGRCAPSAPRRDRWCGTGRRRKSGCASSHVKNGTVVLMPVTRYSPSARRMRAIGERAILGPGDQLRDHRVVEDRHVEPGGRAAVVADARARPARAAAGCGPATAGSCCRDPRRRCGTRSRGRAARAAARGSSRAARRARCGSASARDRGRSPSR